MMKMSLTRKADEKLDLSRCQVAVVLNCEFVDLPSANGGGFVELR
jgi:hypothetical protein